MDRPPTTKPPNPNATDRIQIRTLPKSRSRLLDLHVDGKIDRTTFDSKSETLKLELVALNRAL
jgi:hypothetical protein